MERISLVGPSVFGEVFAIRLVVIDGRPVGGQDGEIPVNAAGQAAAQAAGAVVFDDCVINGGGAVAGHKDAAAAQVSGGVGLITGDLNIWTC